MEKPKKKLSGQPNNPHFTSIHPGSHAVPLTYIVFKVGLVLWISDPFSTASNRIPVTPLGPAQRKKFYPGQKVHSYLSF